MHASAHHSAHIAGSLRREATRHSEKTARANEKRVAYLAGVPAPAPPTLYNTAPPEDLEATLAPEAAEAAREARVAKEEGELDAAAEHFARAAAASRGWATAGWATASFELERARCLRRAQPARLEEAQAALRVALGIFPNYLEALLEQALTALDGRRASDAIRSLERAMQAQPDTEGVGAWLQVG